MMLLNKNTKSLGSNLEELIFPKGEKITSSNFVGSARLSNLVIALYACCTMYIKRIYEVLTLMLYDPKRQTNKIRQNLWLEDE